MEVVKLLLTCFPSDDGSGGAVILRHWVTRLPAEPIHWMALSKPRGKVPFAAAHVTQSHRWAPDFGNVRLRLRRFWAWYNRIVSARQFAQTIAREIQLQQPDLVWLMADFALAPVGLRLLPVLQGRRVHLSIHDDPEPTARREGSSEAFVQEVRDFAAGMRQLDFTADAVSEELLAEAAPTARRTAVVTLPVDPTKCADAFSPPRSNGLLRIGFSGNFLGEREFNCFVEGLRVWSKTSGRDWRLLAFGRAELARLDSKIEAHGFSSADKVRAALSDCDLLLLPSPLDRPEMRTNMPTKLVSYLELGRMVFAFAPPDSATRRVLKEACLGPVISALDSQVVASALTQLNAWDMDTAAKGWHRLTEERFSQKRIQVDLERVLAT